MAINVPLMAGNIVGNVITQYLGMVVNESVRSKNYLEALRAVKSGKLNPSDIQLRQEQPLQVPGMVGDLVRQVVQGYVPLIEEENIKARKYHAMLDAISKGQLDVNTLQITDDGVEQIPDMPDDEGVGGTIEVPDIEPEE